MIGDQALLWTGLGFLDAAVAVAVVWLGHAAWTTAAVRRRRRRRPEILAALTEALQTADPAAAAQSLARVPRNERIDLLVEMAFTVAGDQRRQLDRLARATGAMAKAERWARSRRWGLRLRAARLLSLFGEGTERAGDALLRDPHPDVRAEATEWAAAHPTRGRIDRLVEMLGDPSPGCRFFAREALIRAGHPVIEPLRERLEVSGDGVAVGALEVAAALATPGYGEAAARAVRSPDPAVRERGAALAAAAGGADAARALEGMLGDPAAEVREAAARGLGRLGHWQSAAAVAELLEEERWSTRRAAAAALERMGPTGELLLRRGTRMPPPVADTARHALALEPATAAAEGGEAR